MTNVEETLKDAWNRINYYNGGTLQLALEHPLEWHVAYATEKNKALAFISNYPTSSLESSKCINADCNIRQDKRYYVSFKLMDNSQEDVFITMCSDIIRYSEHSANEKEAVNKVQQRYQQWKKLMEKNSTAVLSDEERRGLIAELLYLKNQLISNSEMLRDIKGWVGPDGADQDFVYNQEWHEIKSTKLSSDKVIIHSVEQLGKNNETGELVVYRIDNCAPEAADAMTLNTVVNSINEYIKSDNESLELFASKLISIGYVNLATYDKYTYKCFGSDSYTVKNGFPRLTRDDIVSEIVNCEYAISIPGIDVWKKG